MDRVLVLDDPVRKCSNKAACGAVKPSIEFWGRLSADDSLKVCKDVPRFRERRNASFNGSHCDRLRFGKLITSDRE